jgi:tRNA nucleotidyltransferase (CCA-adding enzyme)
MREDRLRALRAIRFAARFGFRIDPPTWRAIVGSAPHLGRLSAERVKQELEKTMEQVERPGEALALWQESGALATLVPALRDLSPVARRTLDCLPVPAGRRAEGRKLARLAALVLDLGEREARATMRALRFSNAQTDWVARLAAIHARLAESVVAELAAGASPADASVRRWVAAAGRVHVPHWLRVEGARWAAARALGEPAPSAGAARSLYRRAVRSAYRDPVSLADLAVDGDDLRRAGIPPGRFLGIILQRLLDWVVEDPARNARDPLIARAAEIHRGLRGDGGSGAGGISEER